MIFFFNISVHVQIVNIKKKKCRPTDPPSETVGRQCQTNIFLSLAFLYEFTTGFVLVRDAVSKCRYIVIHIISHCMYRDMYHIG